MMKYDIHLYYSAKDIGYWATVSGFPYISAFGSTYEEALREIQVVLNAMLEIQEEIDKIN